MCRGYDLGIRNKNYRDRTSQEVKEKGPNTVLIIDVDCSEDGMRGDREGLVTRLPNTV